MKTSALLGILLVITLGIIAFLAWDLYPRPVPQKAAPYAKIKNTKIMLEIADTESKRAKGLGDRDSLDPEKGMLFVFDRYKEWPFWMGGMRFALDFLWIRDKKIAEIHTDVLPPSQTSDIPIQLAPSIPINYVIEVNSGWAKKHNIRVGDAVELHIN